MSFPHTHHHHQRRQDAALRTKRVWLQTCGNASRSGPTLEFMLPCVSLSHFHFVINQSRNTAQVPFTTQSLVREEWWCVPGKGRESLGGDSFDYLQHLRWWRELLGFKQKSTWADELLASSRRLSFSFFLNKVLLESGVYFESQVMLGVSQKGETVNV